MKNDFMRYQRHQFNISDSGFHGGNGDGRGAFGGAGAEFNHQNHAHGTFDGSFEGGDGSRGGEGGEALRFRGNRNHLSFDDSSFSNGDGSSGGEALNYRGNRSHITVYDNDGYHRGEYRDFADGIHGKHNHVTVIGPNGRPHDLRV